MREGGRNRGILRYIKMLIVHISGKFGGLAVYITTTKLMAIP